MPRDPSTKDKGRAAVVIAAVIIAIIAVIFIGMNIWQADETGEVEANTAPHAVDQAN